MQKELASSILGVGTPPRRAGHASWVISIIASLIILAVLFPNFLNPSPGLCRAAWIVFVPLPNKDLVSSPYGRFPLPDDPFSFIPCVDGVSYPALNDSDPKGTWASRFDPDPQHWRWGNLTTKSTHGDPYAGRGIYLCGYLDLPLDYLNHSETRIVRIAVAKFQVSGLSRVDAGNGAPSSHAGSKSERTIVVEPGGPGASGVGYVFEAAETITKRFSDGLFDILGWDPRGVNASLPSASCFPHRAYRDHWSLLTGQYRETTQPMAQLQVADAMNNAIFNACRQQLGDFGRFISTASVSRDLEEIRKGLNETHLTGYFVSYGTGIGQTYANMFPQSVGRLILDGPQYVKDQRELGGFGWTSLDNVTDLWRQGFLGECVEAGPENCALAKHAQLPGQTASVAALEARMTELFRSILARPVPAYTEKSGPSLVTYSKLVLTVYGSLYAPELWPALAEILHGLEQGNSTPAALRLEQQWKFDPDSRGTRHREESDEVQSLVICADSWDAPAPEGGLIWWDQLWANMTQRSWLSGNSRFLAVLPCRHFNEYWPKVAEVYRGDLNNSLSNPVLIIAVTYDPATPLRNGKRLLNDMGSNARLVIHNGYGHTSRYDPSSCTDSVGKAYIMHGTLPEGDVTDCFADEKPFRRIIAGEERPRLELSEP